MDFCDFYKMDFKNWRINFLLYRISYATTNCSNRSRIDSYNSRPNTIGNGLLSLLRMFRENGNSAKPGLLILRSDVLPRKYVAPCAASDVTHTRSPWCPGTTGAISTIRWRPWDNSMPRIGPGVWQLGIHGVSLKNNPFDFLLYLCQIVDNFYKKMSTIWQRCNKKSKGLFFMKHRVYWHWGW